MICPHNSPIYLRDVCRRCYNKFAKAVNRGLTTWAALEAQGVVSAPRGRRRRYVNGRYTLCSICLGASFSPNGEDCSSCGGTGFAASH